MSIGDCDEFFGKIVELDALFNVVVAFGETVELPFVEIGVELPFAETGKVVLFFGIADVVTCAFDDEVVALVELFDDGFVVVMVLEFAVILGPVGEVVRGVGDDEADGVVLTELPDWLFEATADVKGEFIEGETALVWPRLVCGRVELGVVRFVVDVNVDGLVEDVPLEVLVDSKDVKNGELDKPCFFDEDVCDIA